MIGLLLGASPARAHSELSNALWVQFEPHRIHVAVNVTQTEVLFIQGLPADTAQSDLRRATQLHGEYVLRHLRFRSGPHTFAGSLVAITPAPQTADPARPFFQYELVYACTDASPSEVTMEHDMLGGHANAANSPGEISYVVRIKSADSRPDTVRLLRSGAPETISTGWIPIAIAHAPAPPENGRTFREYLWHGFMHILTGYDHLLFVSALVIGTLNIREMVKVIAAFTLAHTLTLTLCVFGLVRLPAIVVEPVIAASIVLTALGNIAHPGRGLTRARLALAFGFGLVHGLGFAGGLLSAMEDLPRMGVWLALAAFSIGVETGHQVVVLPLYGFLLWLRKRPLGVSPSLCLRGASCTIACSGVYFLFIALK
jgi:hydrogenase/urease accessory protein HupE